MPEYNLKVGDRLEPSADLFDVGTFDSKPLPFTATFWRVPRDARRRPLVSTLHRNPLFHPSTGLTQKHLMVDMLHTVHLGVIQILIAHIIWATLDANVWQVWNDINRWYRASRIPHNARLSNLTPSMLGTSESP
eukprot:2961016-Pyramimonas_sp.AAC.1